MNLPRKSLLIKTKQSFPVLRIGASTGDVDTFKKIVKAIPKDSGMAYIIVQHLSSDNDRNLSEVLAMSTTLPIQEIINDIPLSPNHIYIIPESNEMLSFDDNQKNITQELHLSNKETLISNELQALNEELQTFTKELQSKNDALLSVNKELLERQRQLITPFTKTIDLLRQKNEQLQKYNEQLENFSTAASHDLQDPLRKILMFCNKIIDNDNGLSEGTKYNLERMKFSINNMSQLVTDLIGYSRSNSVEKEFKKTNMNTLLEKTVQDLKDDISGAEALVSVKSLPVLKVIPYQVQQLFSNLIMNSIKYKKEAIQPIITIDSEIATAEEIIALNGDRTANYVKINVSDNGIGFSQEYAEKIYQPFYRLHSKNSYTGTGLGLALVKKIIVNHNGFIKTTSEINVGTKFSIYFVV